MNKNGEKEGKRSKVQKKDVNKPTKVNNPKGGDNRDPGKEEKCGEADDVSNKFPNFSLLNEEERLVFYQALTAARKNVEKRGVPTRERFGTVHDEYLKYFDREDKKAENPDAVSASVESSTTAPEGSLGSSLEWSADQLLGGEASKKMQCWSPTLLLEGSSEAVVQGTDPDPEVLDQQISDQCESVIQQDTDKMMSMYLNKKKRNEAKAEESPGGKKPSQVGERKPSRLPKAEKKQQPKKKSTLAYQVSEKTRETPRFDELNAEERRMFFDILQEARDNIVGKNPEKKEEILPMQAIVKRYTGERPATSVYSTRVQAQSKRCEGKKNLKVKVTLTSGDNERLQKTKSEDLEPGPKSTEQLPEEPKKDIPKEPPEDVYIDRICEKEADTEDLVEKDENIKPKGKPSSQSVSGKPRASSATIDVKTSPALKDLRNTGDKTLPSPAEAKPIEANKKEDGNVESMPQKQSYYAQVPKRINELQRGHCSRGRNTEIEPQAKLLEDEAFNQKEKAMEEPIHEPLYEGDIQERSNCEEPGEQAEAEEEEVGCPSIMRSNSVSLGLLSGKETRESSFYGVSSVLVQDSQEIPEEVRKEEGEEEEDQVEAKVDGSCFPGEQWGASSRDKHSLMTVKSLFGGDAGEGEEGGGGECSGGEVEEAVKEEKEEEEEEQEERTERRLGEDEKEGIKEFSGIPKSAKVMIVDDNVIERIRKLICYLEAKAGKNDRLEKEYMKLLVDYVDYLSKVLEALVHKKERRKQVQSAYPAKVSLKVKDGNDGKKEVDEASKFIPRSVSAQDFGNESIVVGIKNASEEQSKIEKKHDTDTISTEVMSESDSSLQSEYNMTELPMGSGPRKVVATKIRLLQDLLKQRAEFVEGSTGDLRIVHHPQEEYVPEERPRKVLVIKEEDEESPKTGHTVKLVKFLIKCFTCGKKKHDGGGIYDNLRGEAVRVDVCDKLVKEPANITINTSTMEVLKAAGRKRIIDKYYEKD